MDHNEKLKPSTHESLQDKTQPKMEDLYTNSKKDFTPNKYEDYGYFFFPERFGNIRTPQWYEKFFSYGASRELLNKTMCEENVEKCMKTRILKRFFFIHSNSL